MIVSTWSFTNNQTIRVVGARRRRNTKSVHKCPAQRHFIGRMHNNCKQSSPTLGIALGAGTFAVVCVDSGSWVPVVLFEEVWFTHTEASCFSRSSSKDMRLHLPRIAFLSDPEVLLKPILLEDFFLDLGTRASSSSSLSLWERLSRTSRMDCRVWVLCFRTKRFLAVCASNSSRVQACELREDRMDVLPPRPNFSISLCLRCLRISFSLPSFPDSADFFLTHSRGKSHTTSSSCPGKPSSGGSSSGTRFSSATVSFLWKEAWKILWRTVCTSCKAASWKDCDDWRFESLTWIWFTQHLTSCKPSSNSSLIILASSSKLGSISIWLLLSVLCKISWLSAHRLIYQVTWEETCSKFGRATSLRQALNKFELNNKVETRWNENKMRNVCTL